MNLCTIVLCLRHNFEDSIVMLQIQAVAFGRFGPFRFASIHAGEDMVLMPVALEQLEKLVRIVCVLVLPFPPAASRIPRPTLQLLLLMHETSSPIILRHLLKRQDMNCTGENLECPSHTSSGESPIASAEFGHGFFDKLHPNLFTQRFGEGGHRNSVLYVARNELVNRSLRPSFRADVEKLNHVLAFFIQLPGTGKQSLDAGRVVGQRAKARQQPAIPQTALNDVLWPDLIEQNSLCWISQSPSSNPDFGTPNVELCRGLSDA
mmetsp:Transcript_12363/g.29240  ORF Transcript_12363/g.29240 Transcript_12363/m.29240 type:complete len:263 (-) Transcript_12363:344-1132(-)